MGCANSKQVTLPSVIEVGTENNNPSFGSVLNTPIQAQQEQSLIDSESSKSSSNQGVFPSASQMLSPSQLMFDSNRSSSSRASSNSSGNSNNNNNISPSSSSPQKTQQRVFVCRKEFGDPITTKHSTRPPAALTSKYSCVKSIGSGQYGVVYLVTERQTGGMFAIKVTAASCDSDMTAPVTPVTPAGMPEGETYKNRRVPDYDNLILCRGHPSILQVYETFQSSTKVWLVTEYVSGSPWGSSMIRTGPMPNTPSSMESLRRILHDLLGALQFIHDEVGMAHMDIKPENVILLNHYDETTSVKLIDFGSAVMCCEGATTINTAGTWYYCSPEKLTCRSNGYCPKKADIWALGVTAAVNIFGDHNCPFPMSWTKSRRTFREKLIEWRTAVRRDGNDLLLESVLSPNRSQSYCSSNESGMGDSRYGYSYGMGESGLIEEVNFPFVMRDNIPTPPELLDLLRSMMCPDPEVRPTAKTLLDHAFFKT